LYVYNITTLKDVEYFFASNATGGSQDSNVG